MTADLAQRVPTPADQQQVIQHGDLGQRCTRNLGDQLLPVLQLGMERIAHADPPARRLVRGRDVQPPIRSHRHRGLCVDAILDDAEVVTRLGQIDQPEVIARTLRGRDRQPAAVRTELQPVRRRRRSHHEVIATTEVVPQDLAIANEVERTAVGQPGDWGVPATIDRIIGRIAGLDIEDVQGGLLGTTSRDLVGEQAAVRGRLPVVESGLAGRIQVRRIDQGLLDARADDVQDRVVLPGAAAQEEVPITTPDGRRDHAGPGSGGDLGAEGVAPGQRRGVRQPSLVLRGPPGHGIGISGVL